MKYKKINGKFYLVKDNGEVTNVEVTQEQIDASNATEVTEPAKADEGEVEKAAEDLKNFVANEVKTSVGKAVKNIENIKGIDATVKQAIVDGFKGAETKTIVFSAGEDGTKSLEVADVLKGLADVKTAQGKSFTFTVANAKAISELESLTGNVIPEDRQAGIERAPVRPTFLESLITVSNTVSNKVTYVECIGEDGEPATTAEMAKFAEKDYEFGVFGSDVIKVTVMNKASTEITEDAPQLVSKIREWLAEDLSLKMEDKILLGAGGSGEFLGIKEIATTFNAGNFAGKVEEANRFDVVRVAAQQITKASKKRFVPTHVLVNPEDATFMDLTKNANGTYALPPFISADRTVIKNVQVVETPAIAEGEFIIGDFRKANLANRRGLTIQVATENADDFEKDMLTVRLSRRAAFYVRNNDNGAFVKGNFATAITAINKA